MSTYFPLFKINYGLFLLTSSLNGKYNGCIVNSVNQVAQNPDLIMVSVSKNNYTAKIINETKQFNLSILTIHTPFSLFKRFGYASGKDTNKFEGFTDYRLAKNNIPVKAIAKQLGHSNIGVTMRYIDVFNEDMEKTKNVLDNLL